MKFSSLVLTCYVSFVVTVSGQLDRVSNGSLAEYGEFPYLVSIAENGQHYCGGFVYNDRFIVTTASCIDGKLKENLKVSVGEYSLIRPDLNEQIITVLAMFMFEGYNSESKLHDIALVETSRPMVLNSYVSVIKYGNVSGTSSSAIFAGWGATEDGGIESTKLRKINMTLPGNCSSYISYNDDYMMCAGDGISDNGAPCEYDQGSPLVQDTFVVGIMSKNQGCSVPFQSTVFTRVSSYEPWLTKYAGRQPENGT